MARFLMLPLAPQGMLAHVGACSAVGDVLRERGHEVVFGYGGSRPELLDRRGYDWHRLPEVPVVNAADWFEEPADLRRLVDARIALIEAVRPDVCLTSSGVGGIACEATGCPQLCLMHYLPITRYARRVGIWAQRRSDLRHPARAWRVLRARLRSDPKARLQRILEEVRRELSLPPADPDANGIVAWATAVACTTTPLLDPARGLPRNWLYAGPIVWSAPAEDDAETPKRSGRPLVYVTQGSTGSAELLRRSVAELADEPVDVLACTGGLCTAAELRSLAPNVTAVDLFSGRRAFEAADVAVTHGGHMTSCEAALAGKPVVVLPRLGDQILWLKRVERLGTGLGRWPRVPRGSIRRAVRHALTDSAIAARARDLAAELDRPRWNGAQNSATLAEVLATGGEAADTAAATSAAAAAAASSASGIRQR